MLRGGASREPTEDPVGADRCPYGSADQPIGQRAWLVIGVGRLEREGQRGGLVDHLVSDRANYRPKITRPGNSDREAGLGKGTLGVRYTDGQQFLAAAGSGPAQQTVFAHRGAGRPGHEREG